MCYEEKWVEGWLWHRRSIDGDRSKASDQEMIARMRKALELVVEAINCPDQRRHDAPWLRSALLAARGAALTALGG